MPLDPEPDINVLITQEGCLLDDPDEKRLFEEENGSFGSQPAFASVAGGTSDMLLWKYCIQVLGDHVDTHHQAINDCVSHGFASALEYLQCAAKAQGKLDRAVNYVSSEVIYGMARVQNGVLVDARESPPNGGGTTPTRALAGLKRYGVLPRGNYDNKYKLRSYNRELALHFGNNGVPQSLEARARQNPMGAGTQTAITDFEEAANAIRSGYPVVVGSHVAFGNTRDADGFCRPTTFNGPGHCMVFIGVRGRSGLCCLNSWGNGYYRGPAPDNMPQGAFWVDDATVRQMLRDRQSFAVSLFDGFPPAEWPF